MCMDVKAGDDIMPVAADLLEALNDDYGDLTAVAVAANQIGHQLRMIIMRDKPRPPIYLVNPVIVNVRGHQLGPETCLSLPGRSVVVSRPQIVKVRGYNQYFRLVSYSFRGFQARVFCHELDHLNGKLIIDYLTNHPTK